MIALRSSTNCVNCIHCLRGEEREGEIARGEGEGEEEGGCCCYMLSRFVRALLQGAQMAEARPEDAASKAKPGFILKLGG